MKSQKETQSTKLLIAEFVANGGNITICTPKIAPKRRPSKRKILTREQLKSAIGQRPLSQIAKLVAA